MFPFFKRMVKMTKHFSNAGVGTNGAFMGFDTSESDDTETSDIEQGSHHLDDVSKMPACDLQYMSESLVNLNISFTSSRGGISNLPVLQGWLVGFYFCVTVYCSKIVDFKAPSTVAVLYLINTTLMLLDCTLVRL
jgi:hypothetical protein